MVLHNKQTETGNTEKRKAAVSSVVWSALLTLLKFAAGFASNSIGLISEALHSLLDFVAASITFFAVRWAGAPPDRHHPFGHGKAENLSALAETFLLFITCLWIVWEALDRLLFEGKPVEPTWWAFAVLIISIVVDIGRSSMLYRVAKKYRSQALAADALHFSTDILSTAVVLVGLVCVYCANFVAPDSTLHTILHKSDAIAALAVATLVFGASWRMATKAFAALMDGGMEEETKKVREALARLAPAFSVRQTRVRESGSNYFVDLTIEAPPAMRIDDSHEICKMLEKTVQNVLPGAETIIHFEPAKIESPDLYAGARNLAAMHGLDIHALALTMREDGLHIYVHIELPSEMSIAKAHKIVSAYEHDLCRRLCARHVVSHIEPLEAVARSAPLHSPPSREQILETLENIRPHHKEVGELFDTEIWTVGANVDLSFRCMTNGSKTVAETHCMASKMEAEIRNLLPGIGRISIHFEPESNSNT